MTGSAVLDAGTLAGSGRTVIAPEARLQVGSGAGGTLTINGGHVLAVEAGATGVWGPGPHDIALDAPSRIENAGELDITNDRTLRGSGTLANTGTLRKLSHGTTTPGAPARRRRHARHRRRASSTSPAGTGASSPTAPSRSPSAPACASTTAPRPSGAAASVSGAGEIEVAANAALAVPASATWDIATTYLTGGELALDGERSLATLGVYAGTLSGAGTRTVTGSAVLDTGTLAGSGRTVIAPEARLQVGSGAGGTLTINGGHVLALEAGATGLWGPGPHDITLDAPSRIENAGTLDITNDRTLSGSGTLANTGTLRKLSHGTTGLALAPEDGSRVGNDGTIEVVAGLLDIGAPGLDNRGTIVLDATLAESGQIRTPAFGQAETATYQVGVAGTTPMAGAGLLTVTTADVTLAGTLAVVADPRSSRTRRSSCPCWPPRQPPPSRPSTR